MAHNHTRQDDAAAPILVIGGTGKTGRRVADRLNKRGAVVRIGARSASPAFDWTREDSWAPALEGARAAYVTYAPDLAIPGAADAIEALVRHAGEAGLKRLVLLSGRGEAEAQACERIVQNGALDWTIVRASWFNQNFSEGAFLPMVQSGAITLPAGDTPEPFVDADDIADIAAEALLDPRHAGELYEVTGPRLLRFEDVAAELSRASGREIAFKPVPHDAFVEGVRRSGAPDDIAWMLDYLFSTVLDGRNAHLADGVERALGRAPKDFSAYAAQTAASGLWAAAS